MLRNAAQRPQNNAIFFRVSENNLYCVESLQLSVRCKFHCIAQNHFGAMLIGFGDT